MAEHADGVGEEGPNAVSCPLQTKQDAVIAVPTPALASLGVIKQFVHGWTCGLFKL